MNNKRARVPGCDNRKLHLLRFKKLIALLFLLSGSIPVSSCGQNIVESYAPKNEQEKAELDMESGRFSQAAERLSSVLTAEPENYAARSLLGAAYAAQAGVTTLGLIKSASTTSTAGGSAIQKFNEILPSATLGSLDLMGQACDSMALIPIASRSSEMKLQYSLFFSAYAFLQIKYFTTNAEALANLSIEDAAKLILTLAKAGEAEGSSPLTTAAASFSATLGAAPGGSVEKVKAALAASTP